MKPGRLLIGLGAAVAFGSAVPSFGCTYTSSLAPALGPYSPAAIKQGAVPVIQVRAGLVCVPSTVVLLGTTNYIRGKFHSQNGLKLKSGANAISYVASADSAGTYAFAQDVTMEFLQNNLLNILGLLGGSSADLPLNIKTSNASLPPVGVYTDQIKIDWSWNMCQGILVGGACVGTNIAGIGTTTIDVSMTVAAKTVAITTSTSTTWDPVNNTSFPKSLPGGRKRLRLDATNPDIVPTDSGSLGLNIAIPGNAMIALDGDGTSSAFVQYADGAPASSLALTYTSPSSTSDDVDFSSDNGASWSYVPVLGSDPSQAAVTNVRLRMRGAMAAGSSFSVSLPLKTK